MKNVIRSSLLAAMPLLLVACVSVPPFQTAKQANVPTSYSLGGLKDDEASDNMHRFLDDKHAVLYSQMQGGGGVAVGLLLGPLGAAANAAAIKSQTEKDAVLLKDKLSIDAPGMFSASMARVQGFDAVAPGQAPSLAPALLVQKIDDAHVRVASMLQVTSGPAGKENKRRYVYVAPQVYSKDQLAAGLNQEQLGHLSADLRTGFDWIASTYAVDVGGGFPAMAQGKVRSEFVMPRFTSPLAGYTFDAGADRVGFATVWGRTTTVYSLTRDVAQLER